MDFLGILEANDGSIWFGSGGGVHRSDGKTITHFKSKEGQQKCATLRNRHFPMHTFLYHFLMFCSPFAEGLQHATQGFSVFG